MDKKEKFINAIKENEGIIHKMTLLYTNSKDDQKDLYQEIVYQLWKSFDSFKGKSKDHTFFFAGFDVSGAIETVGETISKLV